MDVDTRLESYSPAMTADVHVDSGHEAPKYDEEEVGEKQHDVKTSPHQQDTFGDEENVEVKYKVLSWW